MLGGRKQDDSARLADGERCLGVPVKNSRSTPIDRRPVELDEVRTGRCGYVQAVRQ